MSNCGLLDGVVHMHVDRCYRAGYAEGYQAALEEMAELEDRND